MAVTSASQTQPKTQPGVTNSQAVALSHAANEFVFAVVGHVGSGTSEIARQLEALLQERTLHGQKFQTRIIKARRVIEDWASAAGHPLPDREKATLEAVGGFQDLGDLMRRETKDNAAVAKDLIVQVRSSRAEMLGIEDIGDGPIEPDGMPRAYILDSIRHPAEVALLRHIYQDAFILIGVVCEENVRVDRICRHYKDAGEERAREFMRRDAKAKETFGQRTSDAFHLADFFVDNTTSRTIVDDTGQNERDNEKWEVAEKLSRLVRIICHDGVVRPEIPETAMHHAHGARMRSACLSRQVGAAIVDWQGNILATGTNEVPRAGGGVYGERFVPDHEDNRCAFRDSVFCSNTREQNEIISEVIDEIPQLSDVEGEPRAKLVGDLRDGRIGDLLEFSRAVHAEMDAMLSAARSGAAIHAARLFVTTFPCHYCARHVISAGIDEVQFIEPYPKSAAFKLHSDAIQVTSDGWMAPSDGGNKVLFRPFSGVAPRLYRRAFLKDRELKNDRTGDLQIGEPDWGSPWHLRKASYVQLEARLAAPETA